MKYLVLLLSLLLLVCSCDYYGDYEYKIKNESQKDIQIQIFVHYWYPNETEKDWFDIKPSETELVRVAPSENLGRNEDPSGDCGSHIGDLGRFIVYSDGVEINRDFRDIKYWTYEVTGDRVGTFLMTLTDSLLVDEN